MRKYIRKIKVKIEESFRRIIYADLQELLDENNYHLEHREIEANVILSILTDVSGKLNKNLSEQTKEHHKFNLKYHEAYALLQFLMNQQIDTTSLFYLQSIELINTIDQQLK